MQWLDNYFQLTEHNTSLKTEIIAGITTFMTMAYIIVINPAILADGNGAGMDFNGVMAATCIASALATLLMALTARYPIALAPGMGLNAFFSFYLCGHLGIPWQTGLGMVFLSGSCFTLLTLLKVREMIVNAIPLSIKMATVVGIGIFIAFIGFKNAGIIADHPNTLVQMGELTQPATLTAIIGLAFTLMLMVRHIQGALLWGIIATGIIGAIFGVMKLPGQILALPIPEKPVFAKLDIASALQMQYLAPIIALLFVDMFDTIGTLLGVTENAQLLRDGRLERATPALLSDSLGTMAGSVCGTSTVTSYIESSAGVSAGGKTGLASVVTALLFLLALLFSPIAKMLGEVPATTAPALITVGFLMIGSIVKIAWEDYTEAIPAFLTIVLMPLTFSISHGLAIGFISYPFLKLAAGRGREVSGLVYVLAVIFLLKYSLLP